MLLPAILVTSLLCFTQAERNLTADVEAFVTRFREIEDTTDVLEGLERLGDYNKEIFELGQPLRWLVHTRINLTEKAGSEEAWAVAQVRTLFNSPDRADPYDPNGEYGSFVNVMYNSMAHSQIHYAFQTVNAYLQMEIHDPAFIKQLRSIHFNHYEPMRLLHFTDEYTRINCRLTPKQGIKNVIRMKEVFARLIARGFPEDANPMLPEYEMHYVPSMMIAPESVIDELIQTLEKLDPSSYEAAVVTLQSSLSEYINYDYYYDDKSCLLEMFHIANDFNQTKLFNRVRSVYEDLLRIELLNWALSSVVESDDESYLKDGEITAYSFERTGRYIAKWVRNLQNVSWPEIGIQAAREALGNETIPTDALNETARIVQTIFEERISPSYAYQVLVVPTSEVDASWNVLTENKEIYSNIIDINGVDIHIFRFNRSESEERNASTKNWLEDKKEDILKLLNDNALANASTTLLNVKSDTAIGQIFENDLYISAILLKKKDTKISITEAIPVGQAIFENASFTMETSKTSYSTANPGIVTLYSTKAFFFL